MTKVLKTGIKKEKGALYYIDKDGDIAMTRMKQFKSNKNMSDTMDGVKRKTTKKRKPAAKKKATTTRKRR